MCALRRYGHQRMFGSLGWGLAMFFVGIALDHSTAFSSHPCGGPQRFEKNYTICFATFSVLMGAALITATQVSAMSPVLPCFFRKLFCGQTIAKLGEFITNSLPHVMCVDRYGLSTSS